MESFASELAARLTNQPVLSDKPAQAAAPQQQAAPAASSGPSVMRKTKEELVIQNDEYECEIIKTKLTDSDGNSEDRYEGLTVKIKGVKSGKPMINIKGDCTGFIKLCELLVRQVVGVQIVQNQPIQNVQPNVGADGFDPNTYAEEAQRVVDILPPKPIVEGQEGIAVRRSTPPGPRVSEYDASMNLLGRFGANANGARDSYMPPPQHAAPQQQRRSGGGMSAFKTPMNEAPEVTGYTFNELPAEMQQAIMEQRRMKNQAGAVNVNEIKNQVRDLADIKPKGQQGQMSQQQELMRRTHQF